MTSCHPWGVLLCIWIVFQECCHPLSSYPSLFRAWRPSGEAWQCVGLSLFYTKGWSYASFEGNSLLCNQTPLFHNHSTLTVAHPLHSTSSDQTEKHTHQYGAPPAVAWFFFFQLGMCKIVWLASWNLFKHDQKIRPLFWRPQWLLKLEIPQQFSCQWGFQDPRHRQSLLTSGWSLVECSHPEGVFLF